MRTFSIVGAVVFFVAGLLVLSGGNTPVAIGLLAAGLLFIIQAVRGVPVAKRPMS